MSSFPLAMEANWYWLFWVGEWIMRRLSPNAAHLRFWALVLEAIVYLLLWSIPLVGWIFGLFATLFGLGAMWFVVRSWRAERRTSTEQPGG